MAAAAAPGSSEVVTAAAGLAYDVATRAGAGVASSAASMASGIGANPVGILQGISVFFTAKDALTAIPLFFSSTNNTGSRELILTFAK